MRIKKPLYLNNKNLISYSLIPLTVITFVINFLKKFTIRKNYKIKTICVGNIYMGGTGKTALCIEINKILKNKYKTVFIKKMYSDQLDERRILESHGKLLSDKDRSISLKKAENKYDLAILDDGLQDKKIQYNLSIACFNTTYEIGNGYLLPAGPLRESLSTLRNYSAIFLVGDKKNEKLFSILRTFNNKIFYSNYSALNIKKFNMKKKYLFFCGIGNPEEFENTLKKYKFNIVDKIIFPDHYNFNDNEINDIKKLAAQNNLEIITTEKDYERLSKKNKKNISFLKVELKIKNKNKFSNFIEEKI